MAMIAELVERDQPAEANLHRWRQTEERTASKNVVLGMLSFTLIRVLCPRRRLMARLSAIIGEPLSPDCPSGEEVIWNGKNPTAGELEPIVLVKTKVAVNVCPAFTVPGRGR